MSARAAPSPFTGVLSSEGLQRKGLPLDAFRVLHHGETIEIPPDIAQSRQARP
jgi:hypothetical protein